VHTVEDIYTRGNIFFTTKDGERVSAATVQAGYVLALDPSKITDAEDLYTRLNPLVPMDHDTFVTRATLSGRTYVEVADRVSDDAADAIDAMDLPGVSLYRTQWRYYPGNTLAARTVGFVGYTGEGSDATTVGLYGLERQYESTLARAGDHLSVNFFAEIFSNLGSLVFSKDETKAGNIVTSIEPTVARMLESELQKAQDTWHSDLTGGIIMDPKTGAVIAADVIPSFDLNDRSSATIDEFRNPLVENVYEFGSIFKALTMASGIDAGAVTPNSTYYDPGRITLDGRTISNYDGRGRGTVDMHEVLKQSLNTGAAYVVQAMGKNAFRQYFLNLKIGSETGVDLPNETYGLVSNLESPRDVEYATASFGQGIAITPFEMVRALAALGNGGVLVTPHFVTKIEYEDGTWKDVVYPEGEHVFKASTSEEISRMLTIVVDEALRNGTVALPHHSIAAKTGTAQIADRVNGGYYADRYLHSFFGYFPSYDPKFIVFLYTVEPKGVTYSSETLTEPFMNTAKFLINYYDIPPDR
jgi:cell division protein FtsI/penicillin-binding protein 2